MSEHTGARHFITVDWCDKGRRGVFCDAAGGSFSKDEPFTDAEMHKVLDVFWLVLKPQSVELTEQQLRMYSYWRPLAEYSGQYGIAMTEEYVPLREIAELEGDDGDA